MPALKKVERVVRKRNIDSGYAWLVLVSSYTGLLIYVGTTYMYGAIYLALLREFQEGASKTSLVPALQSFTLCCGGPFAGIVINQFSCRVAIVIGGILTTAGFALSSIVPNINWAILTAGLIVGSGHCLVSAGCLCAPGFYFEKYRDMTLTLGYIINGFGFFIATPFAIFLLDTFGLSNLFLVCASIAAHICLMGVLIKPSVIEREIRLKRNLDIKLRRNSVSSAIASSVTIVKQKDFLCYLCTNIAWGFLLSACASHLPNYIATSGGTDDQIEYVMMALGISNVIGRVTAVLLVNCNADYSLYGYILSLGISSILTMTFPLYSSLSLGVYGFVIQVGVFTGIPNTFVTQFPVRFVGLDKLSEGNGISYFFMGIGYGSAPFIIGFIYDKSKSYEYSFLFAGIVMAAGTIFAYFAQRLERKKIRCNTIEICIDIKDETDTILGQTIEKSKPI